MRVAVVDIGTQLDPPADRRRGGRPRRRRARAPLERHAPGPGRRRDRRARRGGDAARVRRRSTSYRVSIEAPRAATRAIAVLTSAVRDAGNGAEFTATVARALRARRPHAHRRRGGAPHVPRRDQRARPRRRHAAPRHRHRRRLDRARHRLARARSTSTSPRRSASCARPSATCTPTRRRRDELRALAPRCAAIVEDGRRHRDPRPRPGRRSPSPARRPSAPRSTRSSSPTTPTGSTATRLSRDRLRGAARPPRRRCRWRTRRAGPRPATPTRAPTIVAGVVDPAARCCAAFGLDRDRGLRARHPARSRAGPRLSDSSNWRSS